MHAPTMHARKIYGLNQRLFFCGLEKRLIEGKTQKEREIIIGVASCS